MGGSTKSISTTPNDIRPLRQGLASWLQNGGSNTPNSGSQGASGQWNQPVQQQMATAPGANATPQGFNGMGGVGGAQQTGMGQGINPYASGGPAGTQATGPTPNMGSFGPAGSLGMGGPGGSATQTGMGGGINPYASGGPAGGGRLPTDFANTGGGQFRDISGQGMAPMLSGVPQVDQTPPPPYGPPPGGPAPGSPPGGFGNMYATPQGGPAQLGPTSVMSAPGQINPAQIAMGQIPQVGQQPLNMQQLQAQQLNPSQYNPQNFGYQAVGTQFGVPQADPFSRGQVRDVNGPMSSYGGTQSVDQLGGANSAFFNNMVQQLQPSFSQSRAEALAQAKQGLGNMGGGSALGNSLGTAMNRSLGNEQATLANYAAQGLNTEVGRQLQDASMGAQVGMANANRSLQGQMANQGADQGFLNSLISQGGLGLQGQQLGLQGQMANQGTWASLAGQGAQNMLAAGQGNQQADLSAQGQNANNALSAWQAQNQAQGSNQNAWLQAQLANMGASNNAQSQNIANSMGAQQFNAGQLNNMNVNQAQFNQQWGQLVNQIGAQNAQNYLQALMGMSTTGVGPNQIQQNPGWGAAVGGILGTGIGALAGPIGAGIGGRIGGQIGGGVGSSQMVNNSGRTG